MRYIIFLTFIFLFFSCVPDPLEKEDEGAVIGTLEVDLNANKEFVRKNEAPIGNLIVDAIESYLSSIDNSFDLIVINSGSIRHKREDGIYKKGDKITIGMINEILPFNDFIVVSEVNGRQLKDIFENSVRVVEGDNFQDNGKFLQVSSSVKVEIDFTKEKQIFDKNTQKIVKRGQRITSLKINGKKIEENKIYKIVTSLYISFGGDTFVSFLEPNVIKRTLTDYKLNQIVVNYIKNETEKGRAIEPKVSNRISIVGIGE